MSGGQWAAGDSFTLADCAAAPSLFYADGAHPMDGRFPHVAAYRQRLLARPSVARAVEEARPYRSFFPLGAPDRDLTCLRTQPSPRCFNTENQIGHTSSSERVCKFGSVWE